MASTTLANVQFSTDQFGDLLQDAFTHKLELLNSLAVEAPSNMLSPDAKGYLASMVHQKVPSGDSVQITSSTTTTINALPTWQDTAAWIEREKAWGQDEIIKTVAGYDLAEGLATMLGEYWAGEVHASLVNLLIGIFTTALASTHVKDESGTTINSDGILAAKGLLGDNADKLQYIVMNSKVYNDAVKSQLLVEVPGYDSVYGTGTLKAILGLMPKITDKLATIGGVYNSYIGARGALWYKFRNRPDVTYNNKTSFKVGLVDVELYRVSTTGGGQDNLITRASYSVHCPGVQFDGTVTSNPTNAELATGTTWTKNAPDDKLIPLIQYKSL